MYRQVFRPNNSTYNLPVPRSWYGMEVEVIAFPISSVVQISAPKNLVKTRRRKREAMLRKYSMDLSGFKFNSEEANDYE